MDIDKTLLFAGVAMPVLYFVALFAAGAFYPDYSHIRQVASDLGAVGAPYAFAPVFNVALVGVALAGLGGALGAAQLLEGFFVVRKIFFGVFRELVLEEKFEISLRGLDSQL